MIVATANPYSLFPTRYSHSPFSHRPIGLHGRRHVDADPDLADRADDVVAKQLREGVASLDKLAGGSFVKASAKRRLAAVHAIEGQPFFNTVRGKCVTSLYDNEMAFATFGYPGSAWEKGGYIARGFQDLKWLPATPEEASPPPFMG